MTEDAASGELGTPLVIIGSGIAGYNVAKAFRKLDSERPVLIITRDGGESYYKPSLSNSLAKGTPPDELVQADAGSMAETLKAAIWTRTGVTAVDPARKQVTTERGEVAYHKLVMAVGADSLALPLKGDRADAVLHVNDLDDFRAFTEALPPAGGRIVIIGAGLIGCEFANDLVLSRHKVEIFDIAEKPLSRFVPGDLGDVLRNELAALGVSWHLGSSIESVDQGDERQYLCRLSDGSTLEADEVLSAVGLRPRIELARAAGLATNRGIVVDTRLQTSAPDIYALGDCAELDGQTWPFVMPTMHEARALGATLAGTPTPVKFPVMPIIVKTESYPVVVVPPAPEKAGEWLRVPCDAGQAAVYLDGDRRVNGFALMGDAARERGRYVKAVGSVWGV